MLRHPALLLLFGLVTSAPGQSFQVGFESCVPGPI